jgi:hypothetical protein
MEVTDNNSSTLIQQHILTKEGTPIEPALVGYLIAKRIATDYVFVFPSPLPQIINYYSEAKVFYDKVKQGPDDIVLMEVRQVFGKNPNDNSMDGMLPLKPGPIGYAIARQKRTDHGYIFFNSESGATTKLIIDYDKASTQHNTLVAVKPRFMFNFVLLEVRLVE